MILPNASCSSYIRSIALPTPHHRSAAYMHRYALALTLSLALMGCRKGQEARADNNAADVSKPRITLVDGPPFASTGLGEFTSTGEEPTETPQLKRTYYDDCILKKKTQ